MVPIFASQVPDEPYRALPYRPAAAMLYTGDNQTTADALAGYLFQQPGLSDPSAVQQAVGVLTSGVGALGQVEDSSTPDSLLQD